MSNYNRRGISRERFEPIRRYELGIKEHDQPREIIVDLSRSIYREIHNLFNPPRVARDGGGSDSVRPGRGESRRLRSKG